MKTIPFQPIDAAGEAKLKRILELLSEFMHCDVECKTMIVLTANIPEDRNDVITIVQRIAKSTYVSTINNKVANGKKVADPEGAHA